MTACAHNNNYNTFLIFKLTDRRTIRRTDDYKLL